MVKDGLWVLLAALLLVFQVIAQEVPAEKEKKENTGSRKVKVERELTDAELRALEGRLSKPAQAAMLSVVFPGGGQLYNKSYWKIPIFYSVLSFLGYTVRKNHDEYIEARNNHIYLTDKDPTNDRLIDRQRFPGFQAQNFIDRRDRYRRERDYYLILSILWYGVSVADAAVDAHFEGFDVSDNLSLKISPRLESIPVVVGRQPAVPSVTVALTFR
ncbi:MAG: DUF5683 domain-containing protein [Flammeovirgaceae bacterium]|nr:DUF5683 domain-containing protein [Flammeovirgaceae bacterium]MDW8288862.1 DUF5683 domain-containing protein [Flammeovirgaceae bacterium]